MSSHERSMSAAMRINSGMENLSDHSHKEKSKEGEVSLMKGSGRRTNRIGISIRNVRWSILLKGNRVAIAREVNIEKIRMYTDHVKMGMERTTHAVATTPTHFTRVSIEYRKPVLSI